MKDSLRKPGFALMGLMLFSVLTAGKMQGQDVKIVSMNKYLSNCLYNFSRNINWPEENKSGDFVISIMGSKELYTEMNKLTQNMRVGMQPIKVQQFNTVNDITGYQHIIFVAAWQTGKIKVLLDKLAGSNTLVVTESEGALDKGSAINFVSVEGIMKFEMSREGLKKNNLMASSVLERMAINAN